MAILVVISHVEYIRFNFGLPHKMYTPVVYHVGRIAVTCFFVLSGFLITNNLLKLKSTVGDVSGKLKLFYLKRTLRIFPLYYVIILLSIFVFPAIGFLHYKVSPLGVDARTILDKVSIYYYCLLPQIPITDKIVLPFADQTWSIGVEEMFYLVIPLFVLFTSFKKNWLLIISGIFVVIKLYYWLFTDNYFDNFFFNFLVLSRFECILIGCYISCLFYEKNNLISKIKKEYVYLALGLIVVSLFKLTLYTFLYIHFAILFSVIILYTSTKTVKWLNNKVLVFLGKISFSLYLVHDIAIVSILNTKIITPQNQQSNMVMYIVILLLSVLLGWIFYKLIEEPFLNLKNKLDKKFQ